MTQEQMRDWIDHANYETLLRKWRLSPAGDPFFQGEIGEYYANVMNKKRNLVGEAAHTAASKKIGWEE